MADVWNELFHFESRDIASRLYRSAHERDLNASKAYAIVAAMSQGREFFASARDADELVRPLLLFYGGVALARGATLFLSPHLGEEALRPAHGVAARDWAGTLTMNAPALEDRIQRLPDLRLGFSGGTYAELARATANTQRVNVFSTDAGVTYDFTTTGTSEFEDAEMTFRELLARLPDLVDTYVRTFDDFGRCFRARVRYHPEPAHTIYDILDTRYKGLPSDAVLRERLNLPPWVEIEDSTLGPLFGHRRTRAFELHHPTDLDAAALPWLADDAEGNSYVVAHEPEEPRLSVLLDLYLIAYVLGSLVRYHPSIWFALISRNKGDFMLPIVREAIDVFERRFPTLIHHEMWRASRTDR